MSESTNETNETTKDDAAKRGTMRDFAMSTVVRDNEVRVVEYVGDGVWVERE